MESDGAGASTRMAIGGLPGLPSWGHTGSTCIRPTPPVSFVAPDADAPRAGAAQGPIHGTRGVRALPGEAALGVVPPRARGGLRGWLSCPGSMRRSRKGFCKESPCVGAECRFVGQRRVA